jgi:pimeloyl-ACP methyl ester carboxylesterase
VSTDKIPTKAGGFYPAANPHADVLIVMLHAYMRTPVDLQRAAEISREEYPDSDIYAPKLPSGLFSWSDADAISVSILEYLDALPKIDRYTQIIFIGHSMGAVLSRKVWVLALGTTADGEVDLAKARPWAKSITRIVLLAALNRGWTVSSALSPWQRFLWTLGSGWGNVCRYLLRHDPLVFEFRRGAPFLTTLRLQCLSAAAALADANAQPAANASSADVARSPADAQHDRQNLRRPIIVQLLGTDDDFVAPTDNLDLATGQDFYYIEVENATHQSIVELDEGDAQTNAATCFRLAIKGSEKCLSTKSFTREDVFDIFDDAVDDQDTLIVPEHTADVQYVVFVIHGIRDRGFWTRRIAREVKTRARARGEECRAVTSTYGYFPMGPFLLPWMRRSKVEWLLDQYVTAKSLYPKAKFSYIGHSNGTYLLTKAIEICPAINFRRVVFGGSVVRCDYEWSQLIPTRVNAVLNYVATADWVVAIFPQGLERLGVEDLGGAGHLGFAPCANVRNYHYVKGMHSAALTRDRWDEMAKFVLEESDPKTYPAEPREAPARNKFTEWLGRWAPEIWLLLAVLVVGIALGLLYLSGAPLLTITFAAYLYLLRVVLTRA